MDEYTCPKKLEVPPMIRISDAQKNILKQWKDIKLTNGVYTDKYQLSEKPILGQWLIEVSLEDSIVEKKQFEVAEYVLPKFSVIIETAKNVLLTDGVINLTVRAKYTYGKGVKGKALLSIKPQMHYDKVTAIEKTIDIDGKGVAEIHFPPSFYIKIRKDILPSLIISAIVEEELTGIKQESSEIVYLHKERFLIKLFEKSYEFSIGEPIKVKIAVRDIDNIPISDKKNYVTLKLYPGHVKEGYFDKVEKDIEFIKKSIELLAYLDDNGVASFEYTIIDESIEAYELQCSYLDCSKNFGSITKKKKKIFVNDPSKLLQVTVATYNPKLSKPVKIMMKSTENFSYYVYAVVGRGKLLKADLVILPESTREHSFEILPTFDMLPNASVFVHYITGQKMRFQETPICFETELLNKISITAPEEATPSEDVLLQINTSSESFVGLLGVDQKECITVFGSSSSMRSFPASTSGLFCKPLEVKKTFPINNEKEEKAKFPVIQVRKEFPENWIFDNIQSTKNDINTLSKKLPDTITSWVITGFSLNPQIGLAITDNSTIIKTFRPFFINTNLPYSVKRGELISIPVLLFNYMDQDLHADVLFDNSDNEFEFIDKNNDQKICVKSILVKRNIGARISFPIRTKKIGQITLKISARSVLAGDAIHKKLRVEPEGITIYKNKELYLCSGEETLNLEKTLSLDIPADIVPDSEIIEVSLMGNILGSTISNMDSLVRMPCGCGEQNMVNFVPNIFVLWYLESINELNPSIESKAKQFLEIGYQRELTYRHNDGSYSAFGNSDSSGSTWLTAYVMRSFHQAKKYIDISQSVLDKGLNFLAKTQLSSGCFSKVGRVIDFSHINEIGLTAFVLLAFLENRESLEQYKTVIDKGFEYLEQHIDSTNDLYALSSALYALQQRKSHVVPKLLKQLETLSHTDGSFKWWAQQTDTTKRTQRYCNSHNVEITGYILMTLLEMNISIVPILRWIISQRNSNGGFGSTQETVVGLWALIKCEQKFRTPSPNINVEVTSQGGQISPWQVHVNKDNSMVVQSLELPKRTRDISFTAKGTGAIVLQLSYRFNIFKKEKQPSFQLQIKIKPSLAPRRMYLDVLTEFLPNNPEETISNMVVMEVKLPTGYIASTEILENIRKIQNIKRVESKNEDTEINLYFDSLKATEKVCIPIEAELSHTVTGQKPVPIVIYDYYNIQKRATIFYEIENQIDIEED